MEIEGLKISKTEKKDTETEKDSVTTYMTEFSNEHYKVRIKSNRPLGYQQGEKGLSIEIKNTQTKLDVEMPEVKEDVDEVSQDADIIDIQQAKTD